MEHNNQTYHLLYNHQGSLRAVVDTNGTIVKELQYDSFGNITLDTNSALHVHFGFAGGLYDEDTKLTRFGYRDYDALTGKWTAKDPIGFAGGDTNLYGYVLGDPVNFVDPEGKFAWGLAFGAIDLLLQLYQNGGNLKCVDWSSVGLSMLGGGLLNGLTKGAFAWRSSRYSSTWNARRAWMKNNNLMSTKGNQQRHHWAVPQSAYKGNSKAAHYFNQPWNINPVSPSFNNWMGNGFFKTKLGAPLWAGETAGGLGLAGFGGNGDDCECQK
jgi:RHS repeat-associated protein